MSAAILRLPRRFFDDRVDRGMDTPDPVRGTARHIWVFADDQHLAALLSDAAWYAEGNVDDQAIVRAARTLVSAAGGAK